MLSGFLSNSPQSYDWDKEFLAITSVGFWTSIGLLYFFKGLWALWAAGREHGGMWRVLGCGREEFERMLAAQHDKRKKCSHKKM